jgi:hypothetical protein
MSEISRGRKYHWPPAIRNGQVREEINDPNRISFELQLNSETANWLAGASSANV